MKVSLDLLLPVGSQKGLSNCFESRVLQQPQDSVPHLSSRSFCNCTESGFGDDVISFPLNFIFTNAHSLSDVNLRSVLHKLASVLGHISSLVCHSQVGNTGLYLGQTRSILHLTCVTCLSLFVLLGTYIIKKFQAPLLCIAQSPFLSLARAPPTILPEDVFILWGLLTLYKPPDIPIWREVLDLVDHGSAEECTGLQQGFLVWCNMVLGLLSCVRPEAQSRGLSSSLFQGLINCPWCLGDKTEKVVKSRSLCFVFSSSSTVKRLEKVRLFQESDPSDPAPEQQSCGCI